MIDSSHSSGLHEEVIADALSELRAHWSWFVILGVVLMVLGIVALGYVFAATVVSVLFIGILMLIGGIGQLMHAWRIKNWAGFLFWTASGLLYTGAGLLAIVNPLAGASVLTLLFGATLIAVGAARLWVWFNDRGQRGWHWIAFSGLVTLVTGLLIAADWPGNSVWVLGLLLSFDLVFQGWTLLLLGFALRKRQ